MERILKGTSATISVTFYVDGVATDPSPATATIAIDREDGTVLVPAGTATTHAGPGKFTFALIPTQTAALDVLTAKWTATFSGQQDTLETIVEVVGGFLFSLAEARKLSPLGDTQAYPTEDLITFRTRAEQSLEDACGVAFVPRYARDPYDGTDTTELFLRRRPLSVISATIDGTAVAGGELAELVLYRSGRVYRPKGWPLGHGNVVVKYTHGYAAPPGRVPGAALKLARHMLVDSPLDDRTTRVTSEGGTAEFATAEAGGFDIPEVNAVVERYGIPALRLV